MNYSGEFRERAQIEMSKRLGFENRSECINSLGVKEFARKQNEFYKTFFEEENERNLKFNSVNKNRLKDPELHVKLDAIFEYIEINPDCKLYQVEELFSFYKTYLNIIFKLGYIENLSSKYKTNFIVKKQGKTSEEIISEVRNYSKLLQRKVRARQAEMIEKGL